MSRPATIAALSLALYLAGCAKEGERIEALGARDDFQVTRLFTADGCAVSRFYDAGRYHYFANCAGGVGEAQVQSTGKSAYTVEHWTPTYAGGAQ